MNPEKVNSLEESLTSIASHSDRQMRRRSWRIANNLRASFHYAFQGIAYSFSSQRNFRIQLVVGVVALSFGVWLELELEQLAIIVFTIALVLILELINTAIEAVVDLAIGRRFHPLARIAKDCAAGSVLIAAVGSLFVAVILLLPPLLIRLGV